MKKKPNFQSSCGVLFSTYLFIQRVDVLVELQLHHELLNGGDGNPDGGRVGVEGGGQPKVLLPVPESGRQVLNRQRRGLLQEAMGVKQPEQLSGVALKQ